MNIGKNIKELREGINMTLQSAADGLGMSMNDYQKIEDDKTDITLSQLEEIANQLSTSPSEIIQLHDANKGIRNYFNNNNGNQGVINNIQGVNQQEIRAAYREIYWGEIKRIHLLEKLLRDHQIDFDI